jgi:hypothetical protein
MAISPKHNESSPAGVEQTVKQPSSAFAAGESTINAKFLEPALDEPRTRTVPENPEYDPFALENLRVDYDNELVAKPLLTVVPVRKPNKTDFVRVHPGANYRITVPLIEIKDSRETYMVTPRMRQAFSETVYSATALYLTVNRQNVYFLWPIKQSRDGRTNEWTTSAEIAVRRAMVSWVRVGSNMSLGAYEIFEAQGQLSEPKWPELTFSEILRIAFGGNRLVDSENHPLIATLSGRN